MPKKFKRLVVGNPIASSEEHHQRLGKPTALAVFASDAISSTAYASDSILSVLILPLGMAALGDLVPISIIVCGLLAIVALSYRQTIFAYPSGGGAYVVSRENLGKTTALVAGSSLLVDYILTVAVSVCAGVKAIDSVYPSLASYRVYICLGFIGIMTLANLRGLKESGRLFAGPTYIYVVSLSALIIVGLVKYYTGHLHALPVNKDALLEARHGKTLLQSAGLFVLLKAFSSGAVALSGVEAISNGVPAFKKPESKHAASTLTYMAMILGTTFFGVSLLASRLKPTFSEKTTLLSTMGKAVFGTGNPIYYILQFATFAILILAANTAYADFPRLSSIVARDGFLPRQLSNRGDRLVFSNGVLILAGFAAILVIVFNGDELKLIPLYAVGVFTGFTLSQTGMVVHHYRLKHKGWKTGAVINAIGALATGVVLIVVASSKFTSGAWVPAVLIPLLVLLLRSIGRHYDKVAKALEIPEGYKVVRHTHTVIVLVSRVHFGVLQALSYAKSLAPDRLMAVHVVSDAADQESITEQWEKFGIDVELHTVYSPYRALAGPIMKFIDEADAVFPDDIITVVLPEFVVQSWYQQILHNQSALALKARLLFRKNTVVTSVPIVVE